MCFIILGSLLLESKGRIILCKIRFREATKVYKSSVCLAKTHVRAGCGARHGAQGHAAAVQRQPDRPPEG